MTAPNLDLPFCERCGARMLRGSRGLICRECERSSCTRLVMNRRGKWVPCGEAAVGVGMGEGPRCQPHLDLEARGKRQARSGGGGGR
jgi:hypothetical protein